MKGINFLESLLILEGRLMDKRFLTPEEVANATINASIKKASLDTTSCIWLGILAGIFIGLGGAGNILASQTLSNIDASLARLVGATVFPVGLMLVVICGAELFTGNNLMTLAVMNKKITLRELFRNWSLVYIANFIGSTLLAVAIFYAGTFNGDASNKVISIAQSKSTLTILEALIRGILCNMIVVLAVWMATAAQDIISKIFACWFPIMLFVLCGFEHSVANMFFIPMGMLLGANVTIGQLITNLIVVTIGNMIGGAILIPYMYNKIFIRNQSSEKAAHNK